jgi:hypothetical protein
VSAGGVAFDWDLNGNLLSDGKVASLPFFGIRELPSGLLPGFPAGTVRDVPWAADVCARGNVLGGDRFAALRADVFADYLPSNQVVNCYDRRNHVQHRNGGFVTILRVIAR